LLQRRHRRLGHGWILWINDLGKGIWIGDLDCGICISLYRAGILMTVSGKLSNYKLDLVGVQEVRLEGGGTEPAGEYPFFYRKGNDNRDR
jgi:hypothetical protein